MGGAASLSLEFKSQTIFMEACFKIYNEMPSYSQIKEKIGIS